MASSFADAAAAERRYVGRAAYEVHLHEAIATPLSFEMPPGQLTPTEFETAILERLASQTGPLRPMIGRLHVLSREFTGVGSFTNFRPDPSLRDPELGDQQLGLDGLIVIPSVPNGMGAVLICTDGCPAMLETFTYGDDLWDGAFADFSIQKPGR